jgi:hypothetical protein
VTAIEPGGCMGVIVVKGNDCPVTHCDMEVTHHKFSV